MAWYKIYAGLGGGFGGANYEGTHEFDTQDEALKYAYHAAVECYQSYEGNYGVLDWEECKEACIESGWNYDDDTVDDYYLEEIESWIDYYVDSAEGPDDTEE